MNGAYVRKGVRMCRKDPKQSCGTTFNNVHRELCRYGLSDTTPNGTMTIVGKKVPRSQKIFAWKQPKRIEEKTYENIIAIACDTCSKIRQIK